MWEVTDSSEELKKVLKTFIEAKLATPAIKARLPQKRFIKVHIAGSSSRPNTTVIEIHTGADQAQPHQFKDEATGREVLEEYHQITIVVRNDSKSGGMGVVEPVYGVLKQVFALRSNLEELIALGVYNVRESREPLEIDDDGTGFSRRIDLSCSTDNFIS